MQRLGLCCLFRKAPIAFRTTTAARIHQLVGRGADRRVPLSDLVLHNVRSLHEAVLFCSKQGIGSFRISSRLFPLYTHPELGYQLEELPAREEIMTTMESVRREARDRMIRLTFHPDQFVVLSSPHVNVVTKSVQELEYHGLMARLVGADVINLHGGGGYGDPTAALHRFERNFGMLSPDVQQRLTVENDDLIFTPAMLMPLCQSLRIPLVYDVHHHRCLRDQWSIEEASAEALTTWDREPLFHISSPKSGWTAARLKLHDDFIDVNDMPACWKTIDPLTIDVEAKAKEEAVLRLKEDLINRGWPHLAGRGDMPLLLHHPGADNGTSHNTV